MLATLPFYRLRETVKKPSGKKYAGPLETLGNHIVKKRTELGLYRKDLADRFGVDISTITNWEKNRCYPHMGCLSKIVEFLGYDPFPFETETFGGKMKYYRLLNGLSPEGLAAVLEVDPSSIYHWETNKVVPLTKYLRRINEFLSLYSIS